MLKTKFTALLLVCLTAMAATAQSPRDGRIVGNAYTNSYFGLTYTWPAILKPQPLPAPDPREADSYEFALFSARQGSQPYGVVIVAQKLNVAGPHSAALKGSADLIDRMARSLRPGPILSEIHRSQKKNARGVVFDELTYQQSGKPSAVLAVQSRQYLLVFKCNGQSTAEVSAMENSVLAARMAR